MQDAFIQEAEKQLFNNIINAITDFSVRVLNESADTEKAMEVAGKVLSNAYKIKNLVDDIINE